MKNKKLLKILLILIAVVAAGVVYSLVSSNGEDASAEEIISEETAAEQEEQETETENEEASSEADVLVSDTADPEELCVYVCGCVNTPGVYFLPDGARVYQAVEAAGGLTEDAAGWYVNQAAYISDGDQIYIPSEEEALSGTVAAGTETTADSSSDQSDDGLININTATADELTTLSGIGETKAAAIIAYREENGDFESVEDITNVSGIGESTYEKIKDKIKV